MVKRTALVLFIVTLVWLNHNHLTGSPQEEWDKDNYGKIIGQVVDEETGEPVNEVFKVSFLDCSIAGHPKFLFRLESNKQGHFSERVKPGIYGLYFYPDSNTSRYCFEIEPDVDPENRKIIRVKAGQITKFIKKAKLGGVLKLILVDENGDRIIPNFLFNPEDMKIRPSVEYAQFPGVYASYHNKSGDRFHDGEITLYSLFPGKYYIEVYPTSMGYGPIFLKDVVVQSGQTKIQPVVMDLSDNTGIAGTITDTNGNPIKNALVLIKKNDDHQYFAGIRTDNNGYYKIIGLLEGMYDLDITVFITELKFIDDRYENIPISKNTILQKDVVIKIQ